MDLAERIAEHVAKLPPELRQVLDAELAAGNQLIDLEIGRGPAQGRVALVLNHPFRAGLKDAPPRRYSRSSSENV